MTQPSISPTVQTPDNDPSSSSFNCSKSMKLQWKIAGMDCPSCAGKIEKALTHVEGILNTRVTFSTGRLFLLVRHTVAIEAEVEKIVSQLGFSLVKHNAQSLVEKEDKRGVISRYRSIVIFSLLVLFAAGVNVITPELGQVVFSLAALWGLFSVMQRSWRLIIAGSPFSIETLICLASVGALFLGESAEAAVVLLLYMVGNHLEGFASRSARKGIQNLMELAPDKAIKVSESGCKSEVSAGMLVSGDIIEILPGQRLPVDAMLISDYASLDESALTGESTPVEHEVESKVLAGSLLVNKVARFKVLSEPGDNAIDRIITLIETAEESKAPIERFIERFSRWYTPTIIIMAMFIALLPPLLAGQLWGEWIYKALALLLISCPCALVISTPASITSALAAASRNGILVKGGVVLEQLSKIKVIAFDKTGTLTEGKPRIVKVHAFSGSEDEVLSLSASVELGTTHPLAKAIIDAAQEHKLHIYDAEEIEVMAGIGVKGVVDGKHISVGSPSQLKNSFSLTAESQKLLNIWEDEGNTIAIVVSDNRLIGMIALRDGVRDDSRLTIKKLAEIGVSSVMLTGDNPKSAAIIAKELNIDYQAGLMPEGKLNAIMSLAKQGPVAMVGDGINDAPALKQADVGIAMGQGADVALETADCALTHNRVAELLRLVDISKATSINIRQNIIFSIVIKLVFLITSAIGVTGLWMAILADTGATALVTANALRLLCYKSKTD